MAQYDDINAGAISVVGIVSVIITFVLIVAAQVLYYQYQEFETHRKYAQSATSPGELEIARQEEELSKYTWLDREKGIVSKPIKLSKEAVLSKLKSAAKPAKPN